ncbi:DUF2513 domain-containing protein [Bavariicoccus seileri]|uniref:DUF2513 domain-containing protein n=1 Tax=Bavariicoccus seileri TaxID=549685 RepID=UPI0003B71B6D|nr:DUF2513 domain-containing protein [Bavariicoccus seileri]
MKLNVDCVRDLLISCEELPYDSHPTLDYFFGSDVLPNYSKEDISYSMEKLVEAGFIEFKVIRSLGGPSFDGIFLNISWKGHELLDTIRSETVWNKTKDKISNTVGSASIQIIGAVASSISTKLLGL